MSENKEKEWPSYAKVSKVQKALLECKELDGKYSKDTIMLKQSGSSEPAKVLRFAAELTLLVKNQYTPAKADLLACAEKLLGGDQSAEEPEVVTSENTSENVDSDSVPSAPTERPSTSQPIRSMQQNQMVQQLAKDLDMDQEKVEKVVQAVLGEMNSAYLMGLIALANSLHYLAAEHDKLPGHEARIKTIDAIRDQYVQAGTLTIRKSRST
jgi:hypothetical protein